MTSRRYARDTIAICFSFLLFAAFGCGDTDAGQPASGNTSGGGAEIASQAQTIECQDPARCEQAGSDLYCSRESCSEDGTCESAPSLAECATKERETVCGCDGTQYISACHAKAKGSTSSTTGECPRCTDGSCSGEELICNKCNPEGECIERPSKDACQNEGDTPQQICGCNGKTYDSPCAAQRDGVLEYTEGPCGTCDRICPGAETTCVQCPGDPVQCVERPDENCEELEEDRVCGCDGEEYRNPCAAIQAGVQPTDSEACFEDPPQCGEDFCTAPNETCSYVCGPRDPDQACYEDIPTNCNASEPYCGCDGNTYANECAAEQNGVFSKGSNCDQTTCPDDGCPPIEIPLGGAGELDIVDVLTLPQVCSECGADKGTCVRRPLLCPSESDPVCGCGSNKAYRNECMAQRAGVAPTSDDSCLTDGCDCGPMEYCTSCDDSEGACVQRPLGCWDDHFPNYACGCDGAFYNSPCEARKNGVSVTSDWSTCLQQP